MADNTLRYLKTDYQSQKDALLQRVRTRWPSKWNDFLANSFGTLLIDLFAWAFATLGFTLNRVAGENFVSTMTLRESAVRIGSLTGYNLRSAAPASVACEASMTTAQSLDVTIAKGTLIRTADEAGTPFEVSKDYVIEAGELTPKQLVATFSPLLTGANVLSSYVVVTLDSSNVDPVDSTIDLSQYVQPGQTLNVVGSSDVYTITSLEQAPGGVSAYSRIVLDRPYGSATGTVAAEVYDRRILVVQGQTISDLFVAPATDTNSYAIRLTRTPVIDGSIEVQVNGEYWTQVASLASVDSTSTSFQVKTMTGGSTLVLFGDDSYGMALPSEATIQVAYRIGGGSAGNVDLGTINTSITGLVQTLSNPVQIAITNETSTGQGGQDAETLDQARVGIPAYTRTNDRAVTLGDYQTLAQRFIDPDFGSVAYARATIRTENSYLEGNIVVIYAWTTGSGGGLVPLSPQLKQALTTYMQSKAVGTDLVKVFDGTAVPVPISLRFKTLTGFSITDTARLVKDTIKSIVNALRPGDPLLYSNLVRDIDEVEGVDTFNMATPLSDLYPSNTTQLFTPPQDTFVYELTKNGASSPETDGNGDQVSLYTAQLPLYPVAVWSFALYMGSDELTIVPDVEAGYARILSASLSTDTSEAFWSRVNLLTGQVTLWIKGAPGDLTMELVSVTGYSTLRSVNVYIGYTGDNTQAKRREVRSAVKAWADGLAVGGAMYARNVSNVSESTVSITDVVAFVTGVDAVTRVALDTPANADARITAADYELLRAGDVIINNQVD